MSQIKVKFTYYHLEQNLELDDDTTIEQLQEFLNNRYYLKISKWYFDEDLNDNILKETPISQLVQNGILNLYIDRNCKMKILPQSNETSTIILPIESPHFIPQTIVQLQEQNEITVGIYLDGKQKFKVSLPRSTQIQDIKDFIREQAEIYSDVYLDENIEIRLQDDKSLYDLGIQNNGRIYLKGNQVQGNISLSVWLDGKENIYTIHQKQNLNDLSSLIMKLKNLNPEKLHLRYFKDEGYLLPLILNQSIFEYGLKNNDKIYAQMLCETIMEQKIENSKEECAICLVNKKSFATLPCGHYSYCAVCIYQIQDICAICKEKVTSKIKLYG